MKNYFWLFSIFIVGNSATASRLDFSLEEPSKECLKSSTPSYLAEPDNFISKEQLLTSLTNKIQTKAQELGLYEGDRARKLLALYSFLRLSFESVSENIYQSAYNSVDHAEYSRSLNANFSIAQASCFQAKNESDIVQALQLLGKPKFLPTTDTAIKTIIEGLFAYDSGFSSLPKIKSQVSFRLQETMRDISNQKTPKGDAYDTKKGEACFLHSEHYFLSYLSANGAYGDFYDGFIDAIFKEAFFKILNNLELSENQASRLLNQLEHENLWLEDNPYLKLIHSLIFPEFPADQG